MALARPHLRPLLGLPPSLRHSLYQHQHLQPNRVRHFSLQAILTSPDASTLVSVIPAGAMEALHSTGLPWFIVLPLSAVLIRSALVYPFFQKPLRKNMIERMSNQPLVDAKMSLYKRQLRKAHVSTFSERLSLILKKWATQRYLNQEIWNHPPIPWKRAASFLTLIAASDAIRRLCGANQGLLKFVLGPVDWIGSWILPGGGAAPASVPPPGSQPIAPIPNAAPIPTATPSGYDTLLADTNIEAAHEAGADQILQQAVEKGHINIDSPWFDPSLLTGGFPWAPDLTLADPTLVLPFLFSGSLFASIYYSPRIGGQNQGKATNLQRIMMTVAMLTIVPALQMPTALLMYYTTNIWVSAFQTRWLSYIMPYRPSPLACKRPVRTQPMKELGDEIEEGSARKHAKAIR